MENQLFGITEDGIERLAHLNEMSGISLGLNIAAQLCQKRAGELFIHGKDNEAVAARDLSDYLKDEYQKRMKDQKERSEEVRTIKRQAYETPVKKSKTRTAE